MKNPDFAYARPRRLEDALALLHHHGRNARILAGGQSLLPELAARRAEPRLLVDIGALPELTQIRRGEDGLAIGAAVRHVDLERSAVIQEALPLLATAVRHIGSIAVRNRGTVGGSLCEADPAAELPACAIALDATLRLRSESGRRAVRAAEFYLPDGGIAAAADEILETILFPSPHPDSWTGFAEIARRPGAPATVGLAAHGRGRGAHLSALRLVFFGTGVRPFCATATAAHFVTTSQAKTDPSEAVAILASEFSAQDIFTVPAAMTIHLAGVLLRQVMEQNEHRENEHGPDHRP